MKTLAMLKMEKNFIAHIEKKYPRKPYEAFSTSALIDRIGEETEELREMWERGFVKEAMKECADISNLVDYVFEKLVSGEEKEGLRGLQRQ